MGRGGVKGVARYGHGHPTVYGSPLVGTSVRPSVDGTPGVRAIFSTPGGRRRYRRRDFGRYAEKLDAEPNAMFLYCATE